MNMVNRLVNIYNRKQIPSGPAYIKKIEKIREVLRLEKGPCRPANLNREAGGLIYLKNLPTVIIPDLHARMNFFLHILFFKPDGNKTILEKTAAGELQIVCAGDGFHSELRGFERWRKAFEEFRGGFLLHRYIDSEMRESLGLMEMVFEMKTRFPEHFHFLKGNHENITNENGKGNQPFGKFVYEGDMVAVWVEKTYGKAFLRNYYHFEKQLPLLAVGRNFLISHAEPARFYPPDMIINSSSNPDVIYGLTWTANDASEQGSVQKMLNHYIPDKKSDPYYFGGHRSIRGLYNLRAEGRYVQLHNPSKFIIALINKEGDIDLKSDIYEIKPDPGLLSDNHND